MATQIHQSPPEGRGGTRLPWRPDSQGPSGGELARRDQASENSGSPNQSGSPLFDYDRYSVGQLWNELRGFWLVSPTPGLDTEIHNLISRWEAFLMSCDFPDGDAEAGACSESRQPLAPIDSRAYPDLEGADLVQRFLDEVENVWRIEGQEPPLEFWRLSTQLALVMAELQTEFFAAVVAECRKLFDNAAAYQRKPRFEPDPLAAFWRRKDPGELKSLVLAAEADASSVGCSLPVPTYRTATFYALAIARREEGWASFYSEQEHHYL